MKLLIEFRKDLHNLANPQKANLLKTFFKTGKGEYGEGDKFLGITVPEQRSLIKNYLNLSFDDIADLLASKWHEERLCALLMLVRKYQKSNESRMQKKLYEFYLKNAAGINNWDLVDLSARYIVGHYIFSRNENKSILYSLAQSTNMWQRRIAIIATQYFIRNNCFNETIRIVQKLINDKEDLIHKACGWMLREIGKRDVEVLKDFLHDNLHKMPRTMLRYAIEHFPEAERKRYLQQKTYCPLKRE